MERTPTISFPCRPSRAKLFFGVGLLALFIVFGGPIFGPLFKACSDTVHDYFFLRACRPDEMRFRAYADYSDQSFTLNLDTGVTEIIVHPYWDRTDWGLFWMPNQVHSVFHTILGLPAPYIADTPPYAASDLTAIRAALKSLSDESGRGDETGEFVIYLSAWDDKTLRIYSFRNRESKSMQSLLTLIRQNHSMLRAP